eukprot:COSAG03_NODE_14296_length_469_cov_1.113514_1_plen_39_part_10
MVAASAASSSQHLSIARRTEWMGDLGAAVVVRLVCCVLV